MKKITDSPMAQSPIIDAHHHFWDPSRGDYHWMAKHDPVLARRYGPHDFQPLLERFGISRTVLVQAAATVGETDYLLRIADATPSVAAVVGWIDFENPHHLSHLERWAQHGKFAGVRPMIQDIADPDWMLREDIDWAFRALIDLDLTFDALGFPVHLDNFCRLFQRHPELRVVIDHAMKPQIARFGEDSTLMPQWKDGMRRLAGETGVYCKFSGLVTEAGKEWSRDDLLPVYDHLMGIFGTGRLMWGSDWPVCRLRCSYGTWFDTARNLAADLDAGESAMLFAGTAAQFYRLDI